MNFNFDASGQFPKGIKAFDVHSDQPNGEPWSTVYLDDGPLSLALFGLDRYHQWPAWHETVSGLPVLDFGPGVKLIPGAHRLDWPDFEFDQTNQEQAGSLPYADNSVGGAYAINILEHLWDPRPFIDEVCRVLAPGAPFNIFVPHALSGVYLQDLDHKKPFILDTWRNHFNNPYYTKGREVTPFKVGTNFKFGIKEENTIIVTQLIKMTEEEIALANEGRLTETPEQAAFKEEQITRKVTDSPQA